MRELLDWGGFIGWDSGVVCGSGILGGDWGLLLTLSAEVTRGAGFRM